MTIEATATAPATATTITLCRNAYAGEKAWHCYHWNGRITSGKEDVDENGDCESCRIAKPPYEEEPSFMSRNED